MEHGGGCAINEVGLCTCKAGDSAVLQLEKERDLWKEEARLMTVNRDYWRDRCENPSYQSRLERIRKIMGLSPVYCDTPDEILDAVETRILHCKENHQPL